VNVELLVLVPPRLAAGYRLAGARVDEVADDAAAATVVAALRARREEGVVAVHEPFYRELPAAWQAGIPPLLVALPEGIRTEAPAARRERLTRLLQRAIGYHFVFGEDGG
jgi:vacuolar-type H+-ATPase subunit F/Vma7